jgi:outer membrane protein OmpA-like peptidoglycan-associated protein
MTKRLIYGLFVFALALFQLNCASKKHVKTEVERIDKEMGKIEESVEANETRLKEHDAVLAQHEEKITELSKESQEALQRANDAEKLAQGKLLYEVTLTDDKVKFASGKANLTAAGKEVLDNFITQLKAENKNVYIEIQGNTDNQGSEEYNITLGQGRADAVRQYLSENGIPLHRISTISYGESRPISDNKTKDGRSANRRVVIQVLE